MTKARSNAVANAAKGDLTVGTGTNSSGILAVGTNTYSLVADSAEATGLKWAAPAATGANYTLLNPGGTALSGAATITVSGISNKESIQVMVLGASCTSSGGVVNIRPNNTTNGVQYTEARVYGLSSWNSYNVDSFNNNFTSTLFPIGTQNNQAGGVVHGYCKIDGAAGSGLKVITYAGGGGHGGDNHAHSIGGAIYDGGTITAISIVSGGGSNFDAGTVYVYVTS